MALLLKWERGWMAERGVGQSLLQPSKMGWDLMCSSPGFCYEVASGSMKMTPSVPCFACSALSCPELHPRLLWDVGRGVRAGLWMEQAALGREHIFHWTTLQALTFAPSSVFNCSLV